MRSKSLLGRAPQPLAARNRCSGVPRSHLALEITARARLFVFGNTRKRRPGVSARSRDSSNRRWIRQHFRVSCGIPFGIPFEIALLRTLHCFELCFARLHRHRQVPYANLVCICIHTGIATRATSTIVSFTSMLDELPSNKTAPWKETFSSDFGEVARAQSEQAHLSPTNAASRATRLGSRKQHDALTHQLHVSQRKCPNVCIHHR